MTEAGWLAGSNPLAMLHDLWTERAERAGGPRLTTRQLRLFACGCCRQFWSILPNPDRRLVELAERFADGQADRAELTAARHEDSNSPPPRYSRGVTHLDALTAAVLTAGDLQDNLFGKVPSQAEALRHRQADLLRHIVGNPLDSPARPSVSRSISQLAGALYQGEDCWFALHDALLEGGHLDLAVHFAQPVHPRGCWALDLLGARAAPS